MSKNARIISLLILVTMLIPCIAGITAYANGTATAGNITVTFNGNGGNNPPPAITQAAGSTFAFDGVPPRKGGVEFMGWALSEEDAYVGNIAYYHWQAHTFNESTELYAVWAYKVVLNDGTQGWGCEELTLYKFPGKDLDLFHHKDDIINNYNMHPGTYGDLGSQMVFVEWNTNQMAIGKGNGTAYHEKYTTNSETTLYCVWGYPTVYQADGGTFPVTGTEVQEEFVSGFSYNSVLDNTKYGHFNMPIGDNEPTKAGCRLVRNSAGDPYYARLLKDGTIYALETKETGLNIPVFNTQGLSWSDFQMSTTSYYEGGMNYYAIWEPSVTYKANGANGSDVVEYMNHSGNTLYSYADYTVKSNSFKKSGSTFLGWNTMPDGSGKSYAAGYTISNYGTNEPLVLYAQWSNTSADTNTYTVSFNAMEGYLNSEDQSLTISYGQKFNEASDSVPVPTRVGYTFAGWVNDDNGSELIFDSEAYSLHEDTSYSAKWELHNEHMLEAFKKVANCAEEGYYTTHCVACDYIETINYDKTAHSYENWAVLSNNTATEEGTKVRFCAKCYSAEFGTIDTVEQIVVAYVNKDEIRKPEDFAYVDVINYLPCFVDNGPGNYPFAGPYFSNINSMRNEARLRNPNIKMVYTVCNRNIVVFENWLQTETTRAQFANNLVGVVSAYNLDGLDFDFEFPSDLTLKPHFVALMSEIRNRLNVLSAQTGKEYLLNVATPAASWANVKYDIAGIAPYIDYFNIMNYDLY
ncbi:MAG: InlB B-repeat-containing protein, partial [Clostridia bacterium]|nr:InlB B-repeat-containing protein [Clostridia bacterium]